MTKRSIHWFRKGLRLHDNPALLAACENAVDVKPIFILDPWFASSARVGVNRWRFLIQTLQNLDQSLKNTILGTFVTCCKGYPRRSFPELFKQWETTHLTFEFDIEPYAKVRDAAVKALAEKSGVEVMTCVSNTLYDTDKVIKANGGNPPLTYQRLQTVLSKMGAPPKPVEGPKEIKTKIAANHDTEYGVPTMADLGKDDSECGPLLFPGGESEGLKRLDTMMKKQYYYYSLYYLYNWVCKFEKPKTEPNTLSPSTTVLSPYLKFGCVSARTFYHDVQNVYRQNKNHTQPPTSLLGQLFWREFYYVIASVSPNFDKMEGNPICTQVDWDDNKEYLNAWREGKTGYPFIDAIMIQLKTEGWIHHLARHAVACFLTRGDLWCHWEEGMNVFEEWLLDADWCLNAGNWMWLSASAFFHQYFRVYSPIVFGKKTDKDGNYIRKYLPQLKHFPTQYIYEPWTAPLKVQEKAGCVTEKRKTESSEDGTPKKRRKTEGKNSKITDFVKKSK
ncbi:CRY [Mytilus edulis]|uniref:CRY n=1 Tax=Mytilus edulis TaxID=6550 RepID=A0A8S3UWX7_MYTED|nr:CRY [Mytilus edulis]